LIDAFVTDLAAAWSADRAARAKETPYAFVLYGVEGGPAWLSPYVLTEEGLNRVATRYVKEGYYDTLAEARDALRWSVPDAPIARSGGEPKLPSVEAVFSPRAKKLGETEGYRTLAKAATEALKRLDRQGLFGKGRARERIVLVILTEDTEDDLATPSVKALNPRAVWKRFEAQTRTEGVYAACNALAIAPDGKTLLATGTRDKHEADDDDFDEDDEDENEIIAFDLRGPRLRRRWAFKFPTFGDAGRKVAASPDGRWEVAVGGIGWS
jgi:hypothetical protein